jgi:predicted Zn finger-like uncharacterized protein
LLPIDLVSAQMQLTCSNCSARYLVDPAAIGPTGRMVQCFRCGHMWAASVPAEATVLPPPEILPEPAPVPDIVIRPQSQGGTHMLPAIPVDPGMPLWLKTAIAALFLLGLFAGGIYFWGDRLLTTLAIDQQTARIDRQPAIDGRMTIVISGDIINTGQREATARRLHLVFKDAQGKQVAERAIEIATGRIPPNGRARFVARINDAPAESTEVDLVAN